MEQKLTRQQRRKIDREYQKRFVKAGHVVIDDGIPSNKGVPERIVPGSVCLPSFYIIPNKDKEEFQLSLRTFADTIAEAYTSTPPTVIFYVIFKPHPYSSDDEVEKIGRTILSKVNHENIIMFIHRDDGDIESLTEKQRGELADEIIDTFIKENANEIITNLNIINARMRGGNTDE